MANDKTVTGYTVEGKYFTPDQLESARQYAYKLCTNLRRDVYIIVTSHIETVYYNRGNIYSTKMQ